MIIHIFNIYIFLLFIYLFYYFYIQNGQNCHTVTDSPYLYKVCPQTFYHRTNMQSYDIYTIYTHGFYLLDICALFWFFF